MITLSEFIFPTSKEEEFFFTPPPLNPNYKLKNYRTVYDSKYPFFLFENRELPKLQFKDITILYGNNGSGKSTILNVIAEKLNLPRTTPYNRTDYFDDYCELCRYDLISNPSKESRIITSDDIFDKVLDIRRINQGIDNRRGELIDEYIKERHNDEPNHLSGMDEYEEWKRKASIRRKSTTSSQFIRNNLRRNIQERSNGESALAHFVDLIADDGLYLLDEPENSLSPQNQIQLKYFIEDCVKNHNCQFIISTHSPFLLSLRFSKIYDLDRIPISTVGSWTELDSVKTYFEFFSEHKHEIL